MIKIDRINSELKRQIAFVIENEVKNPLVKEGMITVTRVNATPDLKYAKVYASVFCEEKEKSKDVLNALKSSGGFIRMKLKNLVDIRNIPELIFVLDDSLDYSLKINKLLREINEGKKD